MKIIAFIEAHQGEVTHKIRGTRRPLGGPALPRPARAGLQPPTVRSMPDAGISYEVDPDFLEHARREQLGQPQLPWEA